MCLHSNWLTGAIEGSPENHPLMNFSQSGVNATINTDDPMIQNTWMWNEFEQALVLGATKADLVTFQTNALNSAFISDVDRAHLITQFRQYLLS